MGAREVVAALARLIVLHHGAHKHLRCDDGTDFIAGNLQE